MRYARYRPRTQTDLNDLDDARRGYEYSERRLEERSNGQSCVVKRAWDAIAAYEKDMKERTLVEISIIICQGQMVHNFDTLMSAPYFEYGMNKCRENMEAKG